MDRLPDEMVEEILDRVDFVTVHQLAGVNSDYRRRVVRRLDTNWYRQLVQRQFLKLSKLFRVIFERQDVISGLGFKRIPALVRKMIADNTSELTSAQRSKLWNLSIIPAGVYQLHSNNYRPRIEIVRNHGRVRMSLNLGITRLAHYPNCTAAGNAEMTKCQALMTQFGLSDHQVGDQFQASRIRYTIVDVKLTQ